MSSAQRSRFETIPMRILQGYSLFETGGCDIPAERILSLYFPGIQILLDTKSRILHHHRDTSTQVRGCPTPRDKCDADISQMGDVLVAQSMPAFLEARSNQLEAHRSTELQVSSDFCDYCLEVLDRLT